MKSTLGTVMVSIGLVLSGCSKQQAKLPAMIAPNTHQITCIAPRIKQNQQKLQTEISTIGSNAQLVVADIAAVADAQMKMQETIQKSGQNLLSRLGILGQHQQNLHIEIRAVQRNTQAVPGL